MQTIIDKIELVSGIPQVICQDQLTIGSYVSCFIKMWGMWEVWRAWKMRKSCSRGSPASWVLSKLPKCFIFWWSTADVWTNCFITFSMRELCKDKFPLLRFNVCFASEKHFATLQRSCLRLVKTLTGEFMRVNEVCPVFECKMLTREENFFSQSICLLMLSVCTTGLWSTFVLLNFNTQIYQPCYKIICSIFMLQHLFSLGALAYSDILSVQHLPAPQT